MNLRKPALTALIGSVGSVAIATALLSQAEPPQVADEPPIFEEIDKNGDGAITRDEAADSWLAQAFASVDSNGDGYVTKSEYEAAS
jgi:hypothetical protein